MFSKKREKKLRLAYKILVTILTFLLVFNPLLIPWTYIYAEEVQTEQENQQQKEEQQEQEQEQEQEKEQVEGLEDQGQEEETGEELESSSQEQDQNTQEEGNGDQTGESSSTPVLETTESDEIKIQDPTPTVTIQPQDELSPTNTPTPTVDSSQGETSTLTPTPTPFSLLETGDAKAVAEVDTLANYHEATATGEILVNGCQVKGEVECPIENSNYAEATTSAQSAGKTGENESNGQAGDALITTGEATSSASVENVVNTNILTLVPGESLDEEKDEGEIKNENEGKTDNKAESEAKTGENKANQNKDGAKITTGNAFASANIFELLNTNIVGSDYEFIFYEITGETTGQINLNEVWKEIIEKENGVESSGDLVTSSPFYQLLITNLNKGEARLQAEALAQTGGNEVLGNKGGAKITTGNAFASANIFELLNTNIVGSRFLFGVVNIFAELKGDIIVPNPERFFEGKESFSAEKGWSFFVNSNLAEVEGNSFAVAETGGNKENGNRGDQTLKTGKAQAQANSFVFINNNIFHSGWYKILINNFGFWDGKILGFSSPSGFDNPEEGVNELTFDGEDSTANSPIDEQTKDKEEPSSLINYNQNEAKLKAQTKAGAYTGGNKANDNSGETEIKTGNATALANIFGMVNTNILGSHFFFPIINLFGKWTGHLIFAYPDLTISIYDGGREAYIGDEIDYTVDFLNQGYEEARDVFVEIAFPQGVKFLSSDKAFASRRENAYIFDLGNVGPKEKGSFHLRVQISPEFNEGSFQAFSFEKKGFFEKLLTLIVPSALAAEGKVASLTVAAQIATFDSESDNDNNTALVTTKVFLPGESSSQDAPEEKPEPNKSSEAVEEKGNDQTSSSFSSFGTPKLEISSWHNVGEFVYPGDIVTYELIVKNTGDGPSYDTFVTHTLFDGFPQGLGTALFEIGKLDPGKRVKITFGMKLFDDLPAGPYYTIARVEGVSEEGEKISAETKDEFEVREKTFPLIEQVKATEEEEAKGVSTSYRPQECKKDLLPYILLILLSTLYLLDIIKRKREERKEASSLKKK